jgi:hypothetical protein
MRVPTRSLGTRSGVNWMRLNVPPRTSATVLTVSVLARPGTPSRRTWPPASSATSTRSSIASWPTMTRLISKRASSRSPRTSSGAPTAWSVPRFMLMGFLVYVMVTPLGKPAVARSTAA